MEGAQTCAAEEGAGGGGRPTARARGRGASGRQWHRSNGCGRWSTTGEAGKVARVGGGAGWGVWTKKVFVSMGPARSTVTFSIYSNIFKSTRIDLSKRWSSHAPKIPNKIWIFMEINKEQLSLLLELFKIWDRI
jgi:hypothetical protein